MKTLRIKKTFRKWITIATCSIVFLGVTTISSIACINANDNGAQSLVEKLNANQPDSYTCVLSDVNTPNLISNLNVNSLSSVDKAKINGAFQEWLGKTGSLQNICFVSVFNENSGVTPRDVNINWQNASISEQVSSSSQGQNDLFVLKASISVLENKNTESSSTQIQLAWPVKNNLQNQNVIEQANRFYTILAVNSINNGGVILYGVQNITVTATTTLSSLNTETAAIDAAFASYIQSYEQSIFTSNVMNGTNPTQYTIAWSNAIFGNGFIQATITYTANNQSEYTIPAEQMTSSGETSMRVSFFGFGGNLPGN